MYEGMTPTIKSYRGFIIGGFKDVGWGVYTRSGGDPLVELESYIDATDWIDQFYETHVEMVEEDY